MEQNIINTLLTRRTFYPQEVKVYGYMWQDEEYRSDWIHFDIELYAYLNSVFMCNDNPMKSVTITIPGVDKFLMLNEAYKHIPYVDYNYRIEEPERILPNPYEDVCKSAYLEHIKDIEEIKAIFGDQIALRHDDYKKIAKMTNNEQKLMMFYKRNLRKNEKEVNPMMHMMQVFREFYGIQDQSETDLLAMVNKGIPCWLPPTIRRKNNNELKNLNEIKEFQEIYKQYKLNQEQQERYKQAMLLYEHSVEQQKIEVRENKKQVKKYIMKTYPKIPQYEPYEKLQEGKIGGLYSQAKRTRV